MTSDKASDSVFIARLRRALESKTNDTIASDLRDESHFGTPEKGYRDAAILIAITMRAKPGLLLTVRPSTMRDHAGQIAFPGGKIDRDDKDAVDAALREAHEELGIKPADVSIIGTGELYFTASGFAITPVVGLVPENIAITPDPNEVADWFEIPFDTVITPGALRKTAMWKGMKRGYYDLEWNGYRIWGITAGILANLSRQYHDAIKIRR
jgi:8-oxo-dGTP pyrophosphatase MutT (NUDIX family)